MRAAWPGVRVDVHRKLLDAAEPEVVVAHLAPAGVGRTEGDVGAGYGQRGREHRALNDDLVDGPARDPALPAIARIIESRVGRQDAPPLHADGEVVQLA